MDKASVIKARTDSSKNPLKITCDNMIVIWDNCNTDIVLWDDSTERITVFRPNTTYSQDSYPFVVLNTTYEHIQYMETLVTPKDGAVWVEKNKAKIDYNKAKEMLKTAIAQRGYTSNLVDPNVSN